MNILIVTQYFYPENFKSNDIAFELQKRGYDVTVLTGYPNYPEGKLYSGYKFFKDKEETINGVKIYRSLMSLRGNAKSIRLFLNYFTWPFFASIRAFILSKKFKYDAIIVHQTSPIMQGIPALIVKKIQKIPIYFWVLDLWPESLQYMGNINNKIVLNFFEKIVKTLYINSSKILISSKGFKESILKKGDFEEKIIYFPNWAEKVISNSNIELKIPTLPDGFKVIFTGNIGKAQDLYSVIKAFEILKNHKDIHLIIVGNGREKENIDKYINEKRLNNNIHLLGRYPIETMKIFFYKADALLVSLIDNEIFNVTVPAKLQAYMTAEKPILTMLNGDGSYLVDKIGCGLTAKSGDYNKLANNILLLYKADESYKRNMGLNAINYYNDNFTIDKCISNLENIINKKI